MSSASRDLVPIEHALVDLGALAEYRRLWRIVERERSRFYKLHEQTLKVLNLYLADLEESRTIIELRRDIRRATRGTPATEAQESVVVGKIVSLGSEQLWNAERQLVRTAFRAVAPLVHPDRGGSTEMFQMVLAAYRTGDLTFLTEVYLKHTKGVCWYGSNAALSYAKREIERPRMSTRILQSTEEFKVHRAHVSGNTAEAQKRALVYAKQAIIVLTRELHDIVEKNLKRHV